MNMTGTGDFELSGLMLARQRSETQVDIAGLVETYGPTLFRVAHSVVRSQSEAEDVVQDTFVRVLEHRDSLAGIRDQRVWLVRIAWNLAVDRRRKVKPDQMDEVFAHSLAASLVPADEAIGEARRLTDLLEAIDRLPKLERQVLLLSAVEELSTTEVAGVLKKSESATRALLFRARVRLKERMTGGSR